MFLFSLFCINFWVPKFLSLLWSQPSPHHSHSFNKNIKLLLQTFIGILYSKELKSSLALKLLFVQTNLLLAYFFKYNGNIFLSENWNKYILNIGSYVHYVIGLFCWYLKLVLKTYFNSGNSVVTVMSLVLFISDKFEAVADANRAHHMLLYGCEGEAYSQ